MRVQEVCQLCELRHALIRSTMQTSFLESGNDARALFQFATAPVNTKKVALAVAAHHV